MELPRGDDELIAPFAGKHACPGIGLGPGGARILHAIAGGSVSAAIGTNATNVICGTDRVVYHAARAVRQLSAGCSPRAREAAVLPRAAGEPDAEPG